MMDELKRVEKAIFKISGLEISGITEDPECAAYMGSSFQMGRWNVKYRKAKITPKKAGQFVTLWKRNTQNQTEPFSTNDDFDFYLIAAGQEQAFGFFLFPKYILGQKKILTTGNSKGKRGFRVYTGWDTAPNKQAVKTKAWQTAYFMDLAGMTPVNYQQFISILNRGEAAG